MTGFLKFDLFSQTYFMRFWFSRLCGITANQMLMVAVAWHMYDITHSAWDLGLVGLYQFIPALLMTLPAGQLADKLHRARIFGTTMILQAMVALTLLIATQGNFANRELIFGLAVLLGFARAFQMPSQQALTPLLVPREMLQRAITFSSSGMEFAIVSGPAIGGILYSTGPMAVYASCLVLLLLATFSAFSIRYPHQPSKGAANWKTLVAGLHFVWNHKVVLGGISLDLFAVLLGGATALLPIYARDILHTGPIGLGFLRAAPAIGALCMSLVLLRWPMKSRVGYKFLGAVAIFGAATIVFGISTSFALSMLALMVTGAADNVSVVTRLTLIQLETPDEMRGRVGAVSSIFIGASNQLGEFESGATSALMGAEASVVLGGVGTMLIALTWLKLFPELAKRDRMH